MTKIPVKYIGLLALAILAGGLFHSCTESQQDTPTWVDGKSGILLQTGFGEGTPDTTLLTKLYVFINDGKGYQLSDSVPQVISNSTKLKLNPAELNKYNYRFLFIATPQSKPEIQVRHSENSSLTFGTAWEKIVIAMQGDSMSVDNYYGITELAGKEILRLQNIQGELTRLVGQMVFCFYKTGPGGIKEPVPVNDKNVSSVLDRIYSMDITYENVPLQINFDNKNQPVPERTLQKSLKHTIHFSQTDNGLKVVLPQPGIPVETADSIPGGAIVKGTCLFPSQQGIYVSMVFHYYDTTPVCEHTEKTHTHTSECYTPKTVSLRLPQNQETPGLNILPNHFTINNAGLPCNRIIDVLHTLTIEVNTVWNE